MLHAHMMSSKRTWARRRVLRVLHVHARQSRARGTNRMLRAYAVSAADVHSHIVHRLPPASFTTHVPRRTHLCDTRTLRPVPAAAAALSCVATCAATSAVLEGHNTRSLLQRKSIIAAE